MIGIMIPSAFAQSQIPIEIISKGDYTFGQVISLTFKVDRYLPNTPFEVQVCDNSGCKGLNTNQFIAGDIFGGKIDKREYILSTDIDSVLKKTGILHYRLPYSSSTISVSEFSTGKYEIRAYYGPQNDPVGYGITQFSYSNNLSKEAKQLTEFLVLSKWDIGTSYDFDQPIKSSTPEELGFETHLHDSIKPPRVLLKSEQPEISLSKNYGGLDVFIMQFENEIKAKRYQQEISNFAPAGQGFFYDTGESEFNLHGFSCIRNDRINSESNIQSGGARFDVQSYSCVRDNLGVYVEGSSSQATVAYERVLEKINESDYFQQLEVPAPTPAQPTEQQTQQPEQQTQQPEQQTQQVPQAQNTQQQSKGGGCLIATATFGSEMAPQVQFLRELRDNTVLQTESGTSFMTGFNQFYYSFSPAIADYERENPVFKEAVKLTLTPLLTSLTLLQYTDIDSESEMLGYGIGVILLNIGMYFIAPAVVIMAVRKRIQVKFIRKYGVSMK